METERFHLKIPLQVEWIVRLMNALVHQVIHHRFHEQDLIKPIARPSVVGIGVSKRH